MITLRGLNRATLHRQLLLDRADLTAHDAIAHLVGMQAQEPKSPYVGLWSRLRGFAPSGLEDLLTARSVVRAPLHRATIHLVTATDHAVLEPLLRPFLHRRFHSSQFRLPVDPEPIVAAARTALEDRPRTRAEMSVLLAARWPDLDPASLGQAGTFLLPVVQVPPRGLWSRSGQATWTTAASWLGDRPETGTTADVVRRYLAAFGPATVRDIQAWSGLTRLKTVVEGMDLTDLGGGLYDVPDGVLPDPDTPAPPRFLPEFDNLLLGHHDRTRVISDEDYRRGVVVGGKPTLLVDGFVHGTWRVAAGLEITAFRPLTRAQRADVLAEGARLLAFAGVDGPVTIG
ncbi:winged helix DNA-binding domain-containing protein [Actinosynnema sp. NPDC020468]|uniref:winged helix DNA-binding domain-containing protein n=1 Tax=Actinosynnema sp. NPDC020468 TaxID=3154488 RepID=UPI0033DFC324